MQVVSSSDGGPGFDYGAFSPSVANFLKGQAETILRGQTTSILQTGKILLEAKRYLSHGQFLRWVELELSMPPRTAQAYMQVACWAKGKSATISRLPPSLLYFLSAPSTPDPFAAGLLARLEAGERVNVAAARAELAALRTVPGERKSREKAVESELSLSELPNVLAFEMTRGGSMTDAVAILDRALSPQDFYQVRAIMTSKSLLSSPHLPDEIVSAFRAVESNADRRAAGVGG